jgi:hypothetical protein
MINTRFGIWPSVVEKLDHRKLIPESLDRALQRCDKRPGTDHNPLGGTRLAEYK